ncbi:hypothetical protein ACROYT_G013845 [Oculina patagonica]
MSSSSPSSSQADKMNELTKEECLGQKCAKWSGICVCFVRKRNTEESKKCAKSTGLAKERHCQRSEQTCTYVTKLLSLTVLVLQRMKSLQRERSPFYVCTCPDLMNASIPCGIPNFVRKWHRNDFCSARKPSTYVFSSCISQSKGVLPGTAMERSTAAARKLKANRWKTTSDTNRPAASS